MRILIRIPVVDLLISGGVSLFKYPYGKHEENRQFFKSFGILAVMEHFFYVNKFNEFVVPSRFLHYSISCSIFCMIFNVNIKFISNQIVIITPLDWNDEDMVCTMDN